jgi:hypothetical protein
MHALAGGTHDEFGVFIYQIGRQPEWQVRNHGVANDSLELFTFAFSSRMSLGRAAGACTLAAAAAAAANCVLANHVEKSV